MRQAERAAVARRKIIPYPPKENDVARVKHCSIPAFSVLCCAPQAVGEMALGRALARKGAEGSDVCYGI